jgi:hypothetical protein
MLNLVLFILGVHMNCERVGTKQSGKHQTHVKLVKKIAPVLDRCVQVTHYNLSIIKSGIKCPHGNVGVKVISDGSSILLKVRDSNALQEVRVYSHNIACAYSEIVERLLGAEISIRE